VSLRESHRYAAIRPDHDPQSAGRDARDAFARARSRLPSDQLANISRASQHPDERQDTGLGGRSRVSGSRPSGRHLRPDAATHHSWERNLPEIDGTSCLSPYLHFGHIGPVQIALAVEAAARANPKLRAARDSYFNELIVWRELAVNFVRFTPKYDSLECADAWAKATIAEHARDEREHLYTLHQLENAQTYDDLWNAGQFQMVRYGWMHNYVRMYWAKKILEWTPDAATAMKYAIYLNDKYFLDGRDPNGYAGIAWAILGKFDRAWAERPVFGKIRYMSGASTGRKFNSKRYIEQMGRLPYQGSLLFRT